MSILFLDLGINQGRKPSSPLNKGTRSECLIRFPGPQLRFRDVGGFLDQRGAELPTGPKRTGPGG